MIDYNTVSQSMLIIQQKEVTRKMCENISDNKLLNEAIYQCCKAISEGYEFCNLRQIQDMLVDIKWNQKDVDKRELIETCRKVVNMHSVNGSNSFKSCN